MFDEYIYNIENEGDVKVFCDKILN